MTRADMLEIIWEETRDKLFIERGDFDASLVDWKIWEVDHQGVPTYIFMSHGPEFHYLSLQNREMLLRDKFREALDALISEHGYACTRTPKHQTMQRRVNELFGFFKTGEDELDIHYRIERVRSCR